MKRGSAFAIAIAVSLILILVGFVFFEPLFAGILDLITGSGDKIACKISLYKGGSTARCPIRKVSISDEQVMIDKKKLMEKGPEGTQVMAKEALAKLLNMCLSQGGGYNSKAFGTQNWFGTEAVCLQCYKVNINEDVGVINDFTDYLRDTKVKGVSDKTYLEALTIPDDPKYLKSYMEYGMTFGLAPSRGTFEFKPKKDYIVFFIGLKKGYFPTKLEQIKNIADRDFIRAFFGTQDRYFVYIAESEKIPQLCRIVN